METAPQRQRLVCVLGIGDYKTTRYVLDGVGCETQYSPVAVGELVFGRERPVTVSTLLTQGAKSTHGAAFEEQVVSRGWVYDPHPIPDGRTEQELWQIFETLGSVLQAGDDVVFDPTHGFRSLPIILLSALQYYRIHKDLLSVRVYYGAYEKDMPECPVFDLTPIVALADWTFGLKIFKEYGLPGPLGEQLRAHSTSARPASNKQGSRSRLGHISRGLHDLEPVMHIEP